MSLDGNAELLSKEERQKILSQMMVLAKRMIQLDDFNKNSLLTLVGIIGTGIAVVVVTALAVILKNRM